MLLFTLAFIAAFAAPLMVMAQAVDTTGVSQGPFPDGINLPSMVNAYDLIFGAFTILWGYIAKPLGLDSEKIPFVFVVLAGGVVLAIVATTFGFGNLLQYIFPFLSAIGIYDLILKPLGLTVAKKG